MMRTLTALLIMLMCSPAFGQVIKHKSTGGTTGLLGLSSEAGTFDTPVSGNGIIMLSRRQATTSGLVDEFHVYTGGAGNFLGVVYSDNAGEPETLLATTASTAIDGYSWHWATGSLASSITVSTSTYYWVGVQFSTAADTYYRVTQEQNLKTYVTTFGSPPSTWPTASDSDVSYGGVGVWYAD